MEIKSYEINKDDRLAITLKNGSRIAGTALSAVRSGRGLNGYVTVRRVTGGNTRVEIADVASIIRL